MAISGTSIDYTGRTKDLFISQGIDPKSVDAQVVTYSFGKISTYIAGVQKLIQRYLISLFNTSFLDDIQSFQSSNIQEATHIFNLANWSVIQAFRTYQNNNPGAPEDEQLAATSLTNVETSPGKVHFTVQLVTRAGDTVVFLLPVKLK